MDEVGLPVLEVEFSDCERGAEAEIDDDNDDDEEENDIDEDNIDDEKVPDTEAAISCLAPHTFVLEVAAPTDDFK
jgi:hypothetical protein